MAETEQFSAFLVEFSCEHADSTPRRWRYNESVTVLCSDAGRAIDVIEERYENVRVHMVKRLGTDKKVIVDG